MMKSVFNTRDTEALIVRINSLQSDALAAWGKMNVYQMLKHCTMSEEMFQGKIQYQRLFVGKLFGRMALNGILKNEAPLKKNQPTHRDLKITGTGNFEVEHEKWIRLLKGYSAFSNPGFLHPFFGKMTTDEIGKYVYKHTDHHLRQFGK